MRTFLLLVGVWGLTACSRSATEMPPAPSTRPDGGWQPIPGIAQMTLPELNEWLQRCAPYGASTEARARSPYDPADCDEIVRRHAEWRTPSTQAPAAYLPGLH